jgi:glucokinase
MKYLGIDLGGTNIKTVIIDDSGTVLEKEKISTEDSISDPEKWKQNILNLIDKNTKKHANNDSSQLICGISAPGLVGPNNKQIDFMPGRLHGLEGYNWSSEIDRNVTVVNDAHSACIAEYETFHKDNVKNMLMITLGTGVGGAIILNGELFQGAFQRAGHFGHITVDHMGATTMTNIVGSLEYAIGNFSVKERTHNRYKTTKDLVEAYNHGDPLASFWWLSSVQKLATGIASLINAYSPELIVIGGGITSADDALFKPLNDFLSVYEWRPDGHTVKIEKAKFGDYSGAIGAAFFAKQKNKLK